MSIASTMTALADAVRGKTGATGNLSVVAMTTALDNMIDAGKMIDRSITAANITPGVTSIGNYAFTTCYALTSVTIPASVTVIGNSAFQSTALTSVTLPENLVSIGNNAFQGARFSSIVIPAGVISIGLNAFYNCPNLTDIYCGFAEEAVSGAPWGATNATIHYNSTGE